MAEIDFWRKYIFFPERELWVWPEDYGLKYKEVWFRTLDRLLLYGWWIPRGRYALLFAHGNGGNISHRVDIAAKFYREGFSVFLFDYRGYGKSRGNPTEKGTYKDAEGALKYLNKELGIPLTSIIAVGESLGGGIVVELCTRYNLRAAVLISCATSLFEVMTHLYPGHPVNKRFIGIYDSGKKISKVHSPVLIIHGDVDELVPFKQGTYLFQSANPPKVLYQVVGANHNDVYETGEKNSSKESENLCMKRNACNALNPPI